MNDNSGFVATVLRDLAASTAVILAAWGALGGATRPTLERPLPIAFAWVWPSRR